jgi:putative aldouronate transport system permease protein
MGKKEIDYGVGKKIGFLQEIIRNKVLYLMFLPVACYFLIFAYFPMAGSVVAFKEFNFKGGLFFSPWNGFKNFEFFFNSGKALSVTINTVVYNVIFLVSYTVFSLIVAILINEIGSKLFKKITQSLLFLPYFISWVTVSAIIYNFFNYEYGVVNTVLKHFGVSGVDVYSNVKYWYALLPFLYVWKWVGYGSVIYLAAIVGIDQECYEAATIDGANIFQKVKSITLPLLKPTIIILVLLALGRVMRGEFDMFYQLIGNNGNLLDGTDIIDTLVFRSLMTTQDFGMAGAVGFYQSVLCLIIILIANFGARKYDKDSALF